MIQQVCDRSYGERASPVSFQTLFILNLKNIFLVEHKINDLSGIDSENV